MINEISFEGDENKYIFSIKQESLSIDDIVDDNDDIDDEDIPTSGGSDGGSNGGQQQQQQQPSAPKPPATTTAKKDTAAHVKELKTTLREKARTFKKTSSESTSKCYGYVVLYNYSTCINVKNEDKNPKTKYSYSVSKHINTNNTKAQNNLNYNKLRWTFALQAIYRVLYYNYNGLYGNSCKLIITNKNLEEKYDKCKQHIKNSVKAGSKTEKGTMAYYYYSMENTLVSNFKKRAKEYAKAAKGNKTFKYCGRFKYGYRNPDDFYKYLVKKIDVYTSIKSLEQFVSTFLKNYKACVGKTDYDLSNAKQKRIADYAWAMSGHGGANGCQAFIEQCYQNLGYGRSWQEGALQAWHNSSYCKQWGRDKEPPVGSLVFGSGSGPMGALYGHVGIYCGKGRVSDNWRGQGYTSIDEWNSINNTAYNYNYNNSHGYFGWMWCTDTGIVGK